MAVKFSRRCSCEIYDITAVTMNNSVFCNDGLKQAAGRRKLDNSNFRNKLI
jgi:hypothetical protein